LPGNLISIAYDAKIEKWDYLNSLQNHVFNYLSSAKSLIDLTRKHHINYYLKKSSIEGYEKKINENFTESRLHNFIQQFRNYVIHYGSPPLSPSKHIDHLKNHKVTHRVIISKDILISSGFEWSKSSKEFLNSESWDEYQDLNILFTAYFTSLDNFQKWYEIQQRTLFKEQFNKIDSSNKEFQQKIILGIVNHIQSGKGFSMKAIEERLLYCFKMDEAKKILEIENQKDRITEMVNQLKTKELIDNKVFAVLMILPLMN
jgi:hypothetical protein